MSVGADYAVVAISLLALTACSATNCDPAQAHFLESLQCETGGFQARQVTLQNSLVQAQSEELQQQARASQAQHAATAAQATLQQRRTRLATLDAELAVLRQRMNQAMSDQHVNHEELERARSEMDALETQRRQLETTDPDPQRLETLAARERKVVDILRSME